MFTRYLGSDLEQAGRRDRQGGAEPHQRVKGWREMAVFDAINCLAIDSCQFGEAGLTEIVLGSQAE